MKQGRFDMTSPDALVQLAQEIVNRQQLKRDVVADTRQLEVVLESRIAGEVPAPDGFAMERNLVPALRVDGMGAFAISGHTHRQISQHLQIPQRYYDRLLNEAPRLLADNVNHWFGAQPRRRLVRTMGPTARAFLSDRYRCLDNEDIMAAVFPVIRDMAIATVSAEVTESRLYLKCLFPRLQAEVAKGDVVQAGIVISNSEIGLGAVSVHPMVYRLVCLNGAIMADAGLRKYHVGRLLGAGSDAPEIVYKDDTVQADDRAFMLKLRDTVQAASAEAFFLQQVKKWREATEQKIEGDPVAAVTVIQTKFGLNDGERVSILQRLIQGGDLTRYGLANAITRASQDHDDYDRATDMERAGGQLIELAPSEWREISKAA